MRNNALLTAKAIEARRNAQKEFNPVRKFFLAENRTRSAAIKAKCAQCMGCGQDYTEPGWRAEVSRCTSTECVLHSFRPYQPK